MKKYYLVKVTLSNGETEDFIKLNAYDRLTNNQCNSITFKNEMDAKLQVDTLDYFNCKMEVIKKLDRRTKEFKQLEKNIRYYSVGYLY